MHIISKSDYFPQYYRFYFHFSRKKTKSGKMSSSLGDKNCDSIEHPNDKWRRVFRSGQDLGGQNQFTCFAVWSSRWSMKYNKKMYSPVFLIISHKSELQTW